MEPSPGQLFNEVIRLLKENLLVEVDSADEDLLASGALDSLTLVQLLVDLEQRFSITIPLEQLEIDDFRSVESIVQLIQRRLLANRVAATYPRAVEEENGCAQPVLTARVVEGGEGQS